MDLDQLFQREKSIRENVDRVYCDSSGRSLPIYDGVVDPELYVKAGPRILWILKEPWDGEDSTGGGWSLCDLIRDQTLRMARGRTFRPISYITYGMLNRVWKWHEIPDIGHLPEMALQLRSMAFINAKKLPGPRHGSHGPTISNFYKAARELVLDQINAYQPDYIFGCRPHMPEIMKDLGVPPGDIRTNGTAQYAVMEGRTLFHVYHPNQKTVKQEKYVNDILEVAAAH